MTADARHYAQTAKGIAFGGQPAGLTTLFFTELWERFSYYGMRALLTLFIVAPAAAGGLGLTTLDAALAARDAQIKDLQDLINRTMWELRRPDVNPERIADRLERALRGR